MQVSQQASGHLWETLPMKSSKLRAKIPTPALGPIVESGLEGKFFYC